jgi:hypothetical protein
MAFAPVTVTISLLIAIYTSISYHTDLFTSCSTHYHVTLNVRTTRDAIRRIYFSHIYFYSGHLDTSCFAIP